MQNDDDIELIEHRIGWLTSMRLRGERLARSARPPMEREIGKSMAMAADVRLAELYDERATMIAMQESELPLAASR
jgi:hypothetical protein